MEAGQSIVTNSGLVPHPASRAPALLVLCFVVLAAAVSVTNPLFESSDEIRHYRYVRVLATEGRLPVQGSESVRSQSHHPPLYYVLSAAFSAVIPSSHDGGYEHPSNPFWGYRSFAPGVDNKLQYWHEPAEPFSKGYLAVLVPRWVNILIGAATVFATYALAFRVLGARTPADRTALALAAAAIVAFNPQFIYLSAAINNDVVAALTGTGILIACVAVLQDGLTWRTLVVLGLISGLGLLAKLQVAALGPAAVMALAAAAWRARDRAPWLLSLLRAFVVVGAVVALVSGWWFLRNLRLYGEPTGLAMQQQLWGGRNVADNLWAIWQGLPQLWASLWGQFGYGQIPLPAWLTTAMLVACLVCLSGYLRWRDTGLGSRVTGLFITAFTVSAGAVMYYIAANPAGAMGRFLFPVVPASAILLVVGLRQWFGSAAWTRNTVIGAMLCFALVALFAYLWPAVTYPPRAILGPGGDVPVARVGDVAEILDVALDEDEVIPGEPVVVRVTWRPLRRTEEPLAVFVHLIDEAGVLAAQRDTWPGLSRAPTTSWRVGVPFVDTYRVDLPETVYTPNVLTVQIGLYGSTLGRLPISVVGGPTLDSWIVGSLRVAESGGGWPNSVDIGFEDELRLVGFEIVPRVLAPGESFTLMTVWRVPDSPSTDLQLFAQVVDAQWRVWGSQDGGGPGWVTGTVTDTRQITLIPETPPGTYPVNVGVLAYGTRLDVLGPDGRPVGDFVALGPIRVR